MSDFDMEHDQELNPNTNEVKKEVKIDPTVKEPITDVDKTVLNLKKKIEEITEEEQRKAESLLKEERKLDIPEFKISDETQEKLNKLHEEAAEKISELQRKAESLKLNKEPIKKEEIDQTVAYLKENAVKAVDFAKVKVNEIKQNENVRKKVEEAETLAKDGVAVTKKKTEEVLSIENREKIKKNISETHELIRDEVKHITHSIDEYVKSPEVQEKINQTKKTFEEAKNDGAKKIKDLLDSKKDSE